MIDVYLEVGSKRTLAGAVEWPGWCRIGRNEADALGALAAYGVRYGRVAHAAHLTFTSPADASEFQIVERLKGSAMTDFGAPEAIPAYDYEPFGEDDLRHTCALLRAAWHHFDAAVAAAQAKTLRTGPRGGGRDLDHIVEHVLDADGGHLSRLGRKVSLAADATPDQQLAQIRAAMIETLEAAARGELPMQGPQGGKRPPVRFVARRALWHVLDHVWEIEDRTLALDKE